MSAVREVTYEVLRNLGMTVIFGNPGSTELPFLRDMPSDFRYVLGLHERCAAGMDLPGINMVKLAQGYGMTAQEVDRPEDLEIALREAFAAPGPRLISVNVAKGGQTCMGMDQSVNPPNYA